MIFVAYQSNGGREGHLSHTMAAGNYNSTLVTFLDIWKAMRLNRCQLITKETFHRNLKIYTGKLTVLGTGADIRGGCRGCAHPLPLLSISPPLCICLCNSPSVTRFPSAPTPSCKKFCILDPEEHLFGGVGRDTMHAHGDLLLPKFSSFHCRRKLKLVQYIVEGFFK